MSFILNKLVRREILSDTRGNKARKQLNEEIRTKLNNDMKYNKICIEKFKVNAKMRCYTRQNVTKIDLQYVLEITPN